MKFNQIRKKGNIGIILAAILLIVIISISIAGNANGIVNWFYDDVQSGTPVAPGCDPQKYVVEFHGTLDLINQKVSTFSLDYEIEYIDAHISDIFISQSNLGFFSDEFDSKICLYDVLKGGDSWREEQVDCLRIDDSVTKGHIEKFPFTFKYNLYDNDCNGMVDDHTFNLVAEVETEDGSEINEKTVAIVNGQAVFQNVDQYTDY